MGTLLCLETGLNGGRAWWVAPSYQVAQVGWRLLTRIAGQLPEHMREIRQGDRQILLSTGGEVRIRSADNTDSLRGDSLDFVVLDECAFIAEAAWTEALRPSLADRRGGAMFVSTPKGRNWFWQLWQRGQDDAFPDWASWRLPTVSNPHIDPAEIESARGTLPELIYRQEFMAEFIDDVGAVFRRVTDAATARPLDAAADGATYVVGVDWGKYADFSSLSVMDVGARRQVYLDRFNQIDYEVQTSRLVALCDRFRPAAIVVERNSMGDVLIEHLQRLGLPIVPFTTTNATKAILIDNLALAFERGDIEILNDPVQLGELQAYAMERLPSGMFRYSAPAGMHDDTVMALGLSWFGVDSFATAQQGAQQVTYFDPVEISPF